MVARRALLAAAAAAGFARPARQPATWPNNSYPLRLDTWGDSITWGEAGTDRSQTGYRKHLGHLLDAAGVAHEPIQDYSVVGWGLDDLAAGAVQRIQGFWPDVVIINIGSNDAGNDSLTSTFEGRYRAMLSNVVSAKPDLKVVASWLQLSSGQYGYLAHNEALINDCVTRACSGNPSVIGIMQCQLVPTVAPITQPDGLHPTDYGRQLYGWQAFLRLAEGLHLGKL